MASYVYLKSEPQLWTVGFYDPSGKWHSESDHNTKEEAANRVAFLNGKNNDPYPDTEAGGYVFCGKCRKMKTE
jgi:hypothetical protein